MAWEWVAPASTGVVGVAGVFFTWMSSHQGRKHTEQVARQTASFQKDLAREERRTTAYLEVLTIVNDMHFTVNSITAIMKHSGDPEPTPLPDQTGQAVLLAKVTAYGSSAAREVFGEWLELVKKLIKNHSLLQLSGEGMGASKVEIWKQQEVVRKALNEAFDRLNDQINADLTR